MNKFISEFRDGLFAYKKAHHLVLKYTLWKTVLFSGLINFTLILVLFWLGAHYFGEISHYVEDLITIKWLKFLATILQILLWLIIAIIYLFTYQYITLALMSPFFAYLSEKTEEILTGTTFPFELKQFLKDIWRGIKVMFISTFKQTIYTGIIQFSIAIPILNLITPFLVLIIQMYYLGYSIFDYYNERHLLSVKEGGKYIYKQKGLAIGVGAGFYLLMLIPVIGFLIAPAYASIAGTIAIIENKTKLNS